MCIRDRPHTLWPPTGLWRPVASTRTEVLEDCDISVSLLLHYILKFRYQHISVYNYAPLLRVYHLSLPPPSGQSGSRCSLVWWFPLISPPSISKYTFTTITAMASYGQRVIVMCPNHSSVSYTHLDVYKRQIEDHRRRWCEHLNGMADIRLPVPALGYHPTGMRDVGRPRRRWVPEQV